MQRMAMLCGLMAFASIAATINVGAADPKVVELGHDIAVARWARCHAVEANDPSPHRTPPLRELHVDYPLAMLSEALKTGVVGGHDEMPMFDLGLKDAQALVAYIDSLSPAGKRYLTE